MPATLPGRRPSCTIRQAWCHLCLLPRTCQLTWAVVQILELRAHQDHLISQLTEVNAAAHGLAKLAGNLRSRWQETIKLNLRLRDELLHTQAQV